MDLVSFVLNLPSNSDFFFNYQGIENVCWYVHISILLGTVYECV